MSKPHLKHLMHHHHPHNPYHDPHTKKTPPRTLLERLRRQGVRGKIFEVESEMVVEEPKMAEGIAGGEGEGEDVYSGAMEVLSEGGTKVIKSGEEESVAKGLNEEEEVVQQVGNREEEIEQAVGNREEIILVADDEEVNDEEQPKEVADQTSGGHRDSSVGKLAETMATSERMARKGVDSEDEEEEEENTLIRRPLAVETAAQEERQTEETAAQEER